ncbi:MAG: glycosyltransferase family 2 protein [Patescibacteria group bacterium]|nr:glycosyltransferase family 2 protein [Patescibacteria group bacterium]
MDNFQISVVVPVYNEEKNIQVFFEKIIKVIKKYQYELIFVSDGSTDKSEEIIKKICLKNKNVKLISFTRNFGHQMALFAGYEFSKGDGIISIDADLQDPPELIDKMIGLWQKGAKIVYAKREKRKGESFFKIITAKLFYKLINFLSDTSIPSEVGDFRLLDKSVVFYLKNLKEKPEFLRGLVSWPGFKTEFVYFKRDKRYSGKTHYTLEKMINLAFNGITSFSTKPLRLSTYFGFMVSTTAVLIVFFKSVQHFIFNQGDWLPGWASLFFSTVFLGGVQLIMIGVLGEYIAKIYREIQKRPNYLIKEKINL